jgi:pimeloyl-ACP methyl ester carboxylesterase
MRPARHALALALAITTLGSGCAFNTPVLQRGANERMGVLLNYSCGARPCDPIDPCKPTIVLTHGWNPLPNRIRCTFGPASAAALKCRCGDSYNILSWDWNAVRVPVLGEGPIPTGREQGRMMAAALRARGVDPARTQIIAHSLGTVATAQAAACLADLGCFAQITLLDPPESMHEVIFDELCVTRHARCVENYWAPGAAGYGAHVSKPGVRNYTVDGPHPVIGVVDLSRSSHVYVMLWYYNTIRCPANPCGFQKSVFAHCCGRSGGSDQPLMPAPIERAAPIETTDLETLPLLIAAQRQANATASK